MTFAGRASGGSRVVSSFYLFVLCSPTQTRLALSFSEMDLRGVVGCWGGVRTSSQPQPMLADAERIHTERFLTPLIKHRNVSNPGAEKESPCRLRISIVLFANDL